MQRTQIYLPDDLRKKIDNYLALSGDSLAGFLRKAATERLKGERNRKEDLKNLADNFVGSSMKTDKEIQKWLDSVREERRLADEVREERLQKILKKALKKKG
ncbi:hypothetical protein A2617_03545 [Candidatus Daviesbacteria bacterium RIFOXYD1_FULL_41_10]|uniref:Ribbon-helix-helix protein CopG domain-containing protein n=2 Tax=Candidatus Daviesiibacteriota TaxID=1752718 RepID=A0A1F5N0T2_9BACT|nr:MAG: hypothetical protein UU67_C0008G0003 [Candidatus Daviesbacteria bacterium GW2011_GWB1_41_5]OGE71225.1 MAG: hypothetical protein A2617_03545 [Candidatus Daviesbacteria bacterium RIFOXYD1_FULL_41_10]